MDWKALGDKAAVLLGKGYGKFELVLLKMFRGLLCEKKEGGWELSKGNAAFWLVLIHSMYVWAGMAKASSTVTKVLETAAKTAGDMAATGADVAAAADPGMLDSMYSTISNVSVGTGVPEQEFYLLMSLLGYSALKTTKGGMTNMMGALRGGR